MTVLGSLRLYILRSVAKVTLGSYDGDNSLRIMSAQWILSEEYYGLTVKIARIEVAAEREL